MDRFRALSRGGQIMLVAGVLLLISTFLPWQDFEGAVFGEDADVAEEVLGVDIDTSFSAWHGLGGVLLGLLTLVLVAWLIVRLAAINIPLPVSQAMTAAVLGVLILLLAVIKNLADEESTLWSYLGVVLAAGVAYGAWLQVQEAGGVDRLRSEIPGTGTGAAATAAPAAAATTTAPPTETAAPPVETAPPPVVTPPAPPVADAEADDTPPPPAATPPTP